MHIGLIDHYDSFTYNIVAWLGKSSSLDVKVIPYGEKLTWQDYDALIFSPGPKSPKDFPLSMELLQINPPRPILGICLGMQMMLEAQGAQIVPYSPPLHGKTSCLTIKQPHIFFKDISNPVVARYHSLVAKDIPENFEILATSPEGHAMAVWDEQKGQLGIQFHPESFLTNSGNQLRDNFLEWIKVCKNQH